MDRNIHRAASAESLALQIGDRIADNDPRFAGRVLAVTSLNDRYVFAATPRGHESRIKRSSVYTDGKPRRSGFSLVKEAL